MVDSTTKFLAFDFFECFLPALACNAVTLFHRVMKRTVRNCHVNELNRKLDVLFEFNSPATTAACIIIIKRTIDVFINYERTAVFAFFGVIFITAFIAFVYDLQIFIACSSVIFIGKMSVGQEAEQLITS